MLAQYTCAAFLSSASRAGVFLGIYPRLAPWATVLRALRALRSVRKLASPVARDDKSKRGLQRRS